MTHSLPVLFSQRLLIAFICCLGSGSLAAQPIVTALAPARNTQMPRTASVGVTLSQAVDARSVRALRVYSAQQGGRKSGAVALSGSQLTFAPAAGFKAGETVWATLDTAARTVGRVPLARPHVWQLTAAAASSSGVFSGGTALTLPVGTSALVSGDVDGDGDLDVLALNDRTLSTRLNDGTGSFYPRPDVALAVATLAAALGDMDGDGDLDLVVTSGSSSSGTGFCNVYANDGSGGFTQQPALNLYFTPYQSLGLADMDGDNDLDVVLALSSGTVQVCLNNGAGSFPTFTSFNLAGLIGVAVGDVDSDGDLDLVVVDASNSALAVRFNNGRAIFSAGTSVAVGSFPEAVLLADFDGDGDLDAVSRNFVPATRVYSLSVRLNSGSGAFSGGSTVALVGDAKDFAAKDVDGDGDVDLLATDVQNNRVVVRLNGGTGAFTPGTDVRVSAEPSLLGLADIDDDGDVDLLAVGYGSSLASSTTEIAVRRNGGNPVPAYAVTAVAPAAYRPAARTTAVSVTFPAAMSSAAASVASLRVFGSQAGGRKAGVAAAVGSTVSLAPAMPFRPGELVRATVTKAARNAAGVPLAVPYVWQFTAAATGGTGQFSGGSDLVLSGSYPWCLRLADVDGDYDLDIVSSYGATAGVQPTPVLVRLNNGTGIFGAPTPLLGATVSAAQFEFGDVDSDGDLDFVGGTTTALQRSSPVWLNNGTGTFVAGGSIENTPAGDLGLGDLDGDGDLDMVVYGGVRLNDGQGNFYGHGALNLNVRTCFLADLDADGDLDLLMGYSGALETYRYLNDGTGAFGPPAPLNNRALVDDYLVNDFDGDGDPDLVLPASSGGTAVWANNGSATFSSGPAIGTSGEYPLAAGDVDGDGDLDVLTTGRFAGTNLLLNNGRGVLSAGPAVLNLSVERAALGDLDGDGDLDAVAVGYSINNAATQSYNSWHIRFNGTTVSASKAAQAAVALQAWPNPVQAGTALRVRLTRPASGATLTLQTLLGQTLRTQLCGDGETTVSTESLAPGIYLLTLQLASQAPVTQRVVIQ
ncbi:T9SS type A sorting domain-containing protein [Hymenobacter sp. M29]|uniref:T9SS type A sorting domain-containing protein n=1 Tax=Hymenobacter mellowenesis TaxID=3063995 RepID=A0ABT9AAZ9_9BACT|nr:T9SS type A sorting domain-containing protein [Hymenobacter sp. M29]MDO7846544.1 T9SS type A sorting domain-containing protein [Hymenobacter sp. M29]